MNISSNILHIEDDPTDALLVQELLSNNIVVHVDNIRKGLEELEARTYNAVLLDLGLLDCSGVNGIHAIKAKQPAIPIIVLTGILDRNLAKQVLEAGAQYCFTKDCVDRNIIQFSIQYSVERMAELRMAP